MRVTTKGQVTIPREIREQLNIRPGTEVEFSVDGNSVRLVPTRRGSSFGRRIVEHLRGKATAGLSTDQIMALTRGEE